MLSTVFGSVYERLAYKSNYLVLVLATATAFATTPTGVVGNAVVRPLPLASSELFCGSFGGDNSAQLYLVTLEGAVSRA
jgi:hypothetical protein